MNNNDLFHYLACGLPDVWLSGGVTIRETSEGEVFHIEQVKDLHQQIGLALADKKGGLTPAEFRFLRTEMKLSRKNLADCLDLSGEAIKSWEYGNNPIQKTADACLRNLYLHHTHNDEIKALVSEINNQEKEEVKIYLEKSTQGWGKVSNAY